MNGNMVYDISDRYCPQNIDNRTNAGISDRTLLIVLPSSNVKDASISDNGTTI